MGSEVEFLRDQVRRLNSALSRYQHGQNAQSSQVEETQQEVLAAPWLSDTGLMAPLLAEYDRHMDEMTEQLQKYQELMADIKLRLERVVKENERLHSELRESVELHALPGTSGAESSTIEDNAIIKSLQEQVQLSEQERVQAMELWQTAAQELDRLQQVQQKTVSDRQLHEAQRQQLKDQLFHFQQHTYKLQTTNQKLESTNQQILKTVAEQSTEMEELHCQLRQAKAQLRTATAKVDEMTKVLHSVQDQIRRREEDVAEAQGREDAADRRLQQLQTTLGQLETRLKAASHEAEVVRREQAVWERKVGELQARCTTLEEEKYEALSKVRQSVQVAEEAVLQKEQALMREKQKTEELLKTNETIKLLIQEATVRTRREVDSVRKQCNVQIQRITEELSALQLECADKKSQIERSLRERKAVEEELEKVYKEGRAEPEFERIDALLQRCLNAERLKDDLSLTLQSTQNKMKTMEMEYSEELSRCQEEVRQLRRALAAARDDCVGVSDERLQLQQENVQLRKEMDELRKATMLIQKKSQADGVTDGARQKSTQRWKDEAKNLLQTFETKTAGLKAELKRHKQRSQELEMQLKADHNTINEYERRLAEHQEKTKSLQRRLMLAEQKAASQQLTSLSQRWKTAAAKPESL
uniref:Sodium channel and clathrin linker 1 n=1 Tax=Nothobranchius kuhntae TaxID=321403 RepID=A0A1A8HXE9_NOTKU